jgi:tetratricopeptide (TPR) repeat protein
MSFIAALQSDSMAAIDMAEESRRICTSLGSDGELALADALLAGGLAAVWFSGDPAQAEFLYEQAAAIYRARGTSWEQAFALLRLGVTAARRKNYQKSLQLFEQSLRIFRELDDAFGLARVHGEMSYLYLSQGDYVQARRMNEQALYYDKKLRFQYAVSASLISLGIFSRLDGDYDLAEASLEEAASTRYEFNLPDENSRFYLGCVKLHARDFAQARRLFIEHLKTSQKHELLIYIGEALIGLGAVAAGSLQYERAARLSGTGKAIQDTSSYTMSPDDLLEIEPFLQTAREQLGDTKFESLAAEGHAMTIDQAIEYALENPF